MTRAQILNRAQELRTNHSIDVVRLANDIGIQVYSSNSMDQSGHIAYDSATGESRIYVNESEPITRQRFSIAHEIAHFVLHNSQLTENGALNRAKEKFSSEMEIEADALAAEILMPEELVRSYISEVNMDTEEIDKKEVIQIASTFRVSKFVAAIRLREMDYNVPFLDFA